MSVGGSTRIVVIALLANLGIALAKLVAALVTNSGAMLAEAIHSFADSGNQVLLLVGASRARREPCDRHPLGYGREAYFWALLVAVLLNPEGRPQLTRSSATNTLEAYAGRSGMPRGAAPTARDASPGRRYS